MSDKDKQEGLQNAEEATSEGADLPDKKDTSDEGKEVDIESIKEEKENYKQGMFSAKERAEKLEKELQELKSQLPEEEGEEEVDPTEKKVNEVLEKQNEREAIRRVTDSSSDDYIPELSDNEVYNEVMQYLPRKIDKSSPEAVIDSIDTAVKVYKDKKSIKTEDKGDDSQAKAAEAAENKSSVVGRKSESSDNSSEKNSQGFNVLQTSKGFEGWYDTDQDE